MNISNTGWFAIMIISIWVSATICAVSIKDEDIYFFASIVTVLFGIGYIILKLV